MLGAAGASVNQKVQKRAEFGVHISGYKVTGSSKKIVWQEMAGGGGRGTGFACANGWGGRTQVSLTFTFICHFHFHFLTLLLFTTFTLICHFHLYFHLPLSLSLGLLVQMGGE